MHKVVIVTGACGGIGRACVTRFAGAGWRVIALDVAADRVSDAALQLECDVADEAAVQSAIASIERAFPTVHAIVNNAAIQLDKPLLETSAADWDTVMGANARGVFLGIRYGAPLLRAAGGGAIVNVASVHALATSARIAAYAASKGAVLALTRAAAIELAPLDIRVNAILPGAVDTPMLRDGLARGHLETGPVESKLKELARRTVIGRVGLPDEIASAVLFLADDDQSSFMTGQALVIDGGATARLSTE